MFLKSYVYENIFSKLFSLMFFRKFNLSKISCYTVSQTILSSSSLIITYTGSKIDTGKSLHYIIFCVLFFSFWFSPWKLHLVLNLA